MLRSMYAGVTGLRNHQLRMDVIGSNIANVNTVGYKKGRVTFRDALYQSLRGASSPQQNRGGTNPQQIGLGMNLGTVDIVHSGGSAQTTGKMTDLCIQGEGFFILSDGGRTFYTRAGVFDFDTRGNYVSSANGYQVMGYLADEKGVLNTGSLKPISLANYSSAPPKATENVKLTGNLDASYPVFDENSPSRGGSKTLTKTVYDSLGSEHTLELTFKKTDVSQWEVTVAFDGAAPASGQSTTLTFDSQGKVNTGSNPAELEVQITGLTDNAKDMTIKVDFSSLTQYDADWTAWPEYQDGYAKGDLRSFTIDATGTIVGSYSNGQTKNIAQVALTTFRNPAGLLAVGDSLYQYTPNSGDPAEGTPGTEARGTIIPGALEMSNVDLSQEFTEMITTQRGFQANSRIITTSDEMLQELVNLKR